MDNLGITLQQIVSICITFNKNGVSTVMKGSKTCWVNNKSNFISDNINEMQMLLFISKFVLQCLQKFWNVSYET